ncbi:MAG TPA: protein-glutamate O-methyltransferase CheR [Phycisphaerae bacterium]|nr:protein-glutamate O-methyltransferase CheR [Phycisphaerae bacterium]HNU46377.1 protein-glutamate O-methyltransferase CheR [Phycisphaerae bacterium]
MAPATKDLTREDYELFRRLVYAKSGINLGEHKMQLVRARLGKRVRQGNFPSFRDYYKHVEQDATGEELTSLLDAISTNTTHLFREARHFAFLRDTLKRWAEDPGWRRRNPTIRIWSAGCSSGEEPHSIVMVAHDVVHRYPELDLKILATDLSTQVLSRAQLGLYEMHRVGTVPAEYRSRYLKKVRHEDQPWFQLVPELRALITFARFNLMTPTFPFKHGFHIIFCRNVMIYFDKPTQQALVNKFAVHLHEGGYLMIGHSESLNSLQQPLAYVEPTIYRKG